MAEQSRVTLLPIIRRATKSVVGGLSLGGFQTFDGDETTYELPSEVTVSIEKWTPNSANSDGHNASWFMAMVIDEENYKSEAYQGYAEFVALSEMDDTTVYTSSTGSPNQKTYTPGTLIDVLSNKSVRYS